MKKRFGTFICLYFVLAVLLAPRAFAAEIIDSGYCGGEGDGTNLTWTLDSEGTLTISGEGKMADYWRDAPWFNWRDSIKRLIIMEKVATVGMDAFAKCCSLAEAIIPDSVTDIGAYAFYWCTELTSISLPYGITEIPEYAFYKCESLVEVHLHDSVTYIGESAFSNCSALRKIVIPNSVTIIEAFAFQGCSALTEITLPNSITALESHVLSGCYSLPQIIIPNSVISIEDYALSWCWGLTEVVIPNNVMSIGYDAFYGSTPLKKLVFRGKAPTIHANAFTDFSGENGLQMDVLYPADNPTWTADKLQNYGGTLTWVPYTKAMIYHTQFSLESIPQDEFNLKITVTQLGESADDVAMIAMYSPEGQFLEMTVWELSNETAQTYTLSRDNTDGKIGQIKVFILDSLSNPIPLAEGAEIASDT